MRDGMATSTVIQPNLESAPQAPASRSASDQSDESHSNATTAPDLNAPWFGQQYAAMATVGALLVTVCLLLAKFLRRGSEIGLRRALGASRGAIFKQCLVEAGLIGLMGGVGGWLLTLLGLWLIRQQQAAYADLAHLELPMFLATFVLAVAASLLAGLLPALRASRIAPALHLKTL